jgi:hypothetical protein
MPRPCAVEAHARGYKIRRKGFADATALCRGGSRFPLKRLSVTTKSIQLETPRRKAVASQGVLQCFYSRKRESPRRKAVASKY